MRISLEPACILHTRPWRDSSLILEVLTRAHGRIAVVARGARRPKSRLSGLLQPFRPLLISAGGRGEMATLTGAEARAQGAWPLLTQGRALISGFYLNELLMKLLTRHDPHPRLFDAYDAALTALAAPALDPGAEQRALRLFEQKLLNEIGYGLVLDRDVASGAPIDAALEYDYHPERGPVAVAPFDGVREGGAGPAGATVRLRGSSLLDLAHGELRDAESLREVRRLMRMAIGLCLGGQPLRSRELFRSRPPSAATTASEDIAGAQTESSS